MNLTRAMVLDIVGPVRKKVMDKMPPWNKDWELRNIWVWFEFNNRYRLILQDEIRSREEGWKWGLFVD